MKEDLLQAELNVLMLTLALKDHVTVEERSTGVLVGFEIGPSIIRLMTEDACQMLGGLVAQRMWTECEKRQSDNNVA